VRVAIVSDIHGNLTAFDAVLADLRRASPDLILHGGDLANGGSSPVEIVDRMRDLNWPGVMGNADEAMSRPESLTEFAAQAPALHHLFQAVEEMSAWSRAALGADRIAWLSRLPRVHLESPLALVHAHPDDVWRAPALQAPDADLESVYAPLRQPMVVYGHIHTPFVRSVSGMTIVNSGSAGLPYDGDPRACYILIEDGAVTIRRVEYDVDREIAALRASGCPHSEWVVRMLKSAGPVML
jgi:putative phosphoesterase